MSGPHERTKSMYSLPSTSQMRAPSPRSTTNGSPPTPWKARTGELTPPGKSSRARAISACDRVVSCCSNCSVMMSSAEAPDRGAHHGQRARRAYGRGTRHVDDAQHRGAEVHVVLDRLDHRVHDRAGLQPLGAL